MTELEHNITVILIDNSLERYFLLYFFVFILSEKVNFYNICRLHKSTQNYQACKELMNGILQCQRFFWYLF